MAHLPEVITTLQKCKKLNYEHCTSIPLQINHSGLKGPDPLPDVHSNQ